MEDKIRVLMVDDEKQFRVTTKKILDNRGFETIIASDGDEALEKIKEKPDVVILDIKMPGMSGIEVLKEIKNISPKTPVIMLTGYGTKDSAKQALLDDAFDYLNKPCEIDLLASKIKNAYLSGREEGPLEEKRVKDIMIPIQEYTILDPDSTVKDAVMKLKESFSSKFSSSHIMETGHRSLLVIDKRGKLKGILAIIDLLKGIMPAYLNAPKPSMADSIKYSPMFWRGMFIKEVEKLSKKKIKEIMSPAPMTIDENSNLMEASYYMLSNNERRGAVTSREDVVGIIREQDLFFEIERILRQ